MKQKMRVIRCNEHKSPEVNNNILSLYGPNPRLQVIPRSQQLDFCLKLDPLDTGFDNYRDAKENFRLEGIIEPPRLVNLYDSADEDHEDLYLWLSAKDGEHVPLLVFYQPEAYCLAAVMNNKSFREVQTGELLIQWKQPFLVLDLPDLGKTIARLNLFFHSRLAVQLAEYRDCKDFHFMLEKIYSPEGEYLGVYWIGCNLESELMLFLPLLGEKINAEIPFDGDLSLLKRVPLKHFETFTAGGMKLVHLQEGEEACVIPAIDFVSPENSYKKIAGG